MADEAAMASKNALAEAQRGPFSMGCKIGGGSVIAKVSSDPRSASELSLGVGEGLLATDATDSRG